MCWCCFILHTRMHIIYIFKSLAAVASDDFQFYLLKVVFACFNLSSHCNCKSNLATVVAFSLSPPGLVADIFNCLYHQRPPFFSFKMGLPPATTRALKLSIVAYLLSTAVAIFLPDQLTGQVTVGKFICEQIIFYLGSFAVFLSWELSHHLHQVGSSSILIATFQSFLFSPLFPS